MTKDGIPGPLAQAVQLGSGELTIEEVVRVARYGWLVAEIDGESGGAAVREAYQRFVTSRQWVEAAVEENERRLQRGETQLLAYYGINTGFGSKAGSQGLCAEDIPWISRNLIVSHSTGVGEALHPEVVRAAMLIRANSLAQGYSGVRLEVVNTLVRMLNRGVIPVVPEYGSVGASGDLIPLSHLALVVSKRPATGDNISEDSLQEYDESGQAYLALSAEDDLAAFTGVVTIDGLRYARLSGHVAMRLRGIEPLELGAKEGLALNNGTAFSAALAVLALYDAENLARHSEIGAAMSLEALLGFRDAFLPQVQAIRRHKGQSACAERILKIVEGSNLLDGAADQDPRYIPPQDPYSLRVTPQVVGAVWDVLEFIRRLITEEINAATDNPFIFLDLRRSYKTVSGGNFHGAPLAYAMDFLSIVMTDLGSLCERRIFRLMDDRLNQGLPDMLVEDQPDTPGRTSGLMMAQYLAADLVSDCKTLAHPDSVDSIPTSASQEDHVSMSMNAARHARQVVKNVAYIVAIELLCAYLALDWRVRDLENRTERGLEATSVRVELWLEHFGSDTKPQVGKGCQVALEVIEGYLYGDGARLPELGKQPTREDRFLQPYVRRMDDLLRSEAILQRVYQEVDLPALSQT